MRILFTILKKTLKNTEETRLLDHSKLTNTQKIIKDKSSNPEHEKKGKKLKKLVIYCAVAIAFAGQAFAQESKPESAAQAQTQNGEVPMTQEEANAFFQGKKLSGENINWKVQFQYEAGGTVYGTNNAGKSDTGQYSIDAEGKICHKWRTWRDSCGQLMKLPDGSVRQISPSGGTWMLYKSNG